MDSTEDTNREQRKRRPNGRQRSANGKADAAPISPEERLQRISETAYYKAQQRGFETGNEDRDWLEAEQEVDALIDSQDPKSRA
jgi:hypothetical protein